MSTLTHNLAELAPLANAIVHSISYDTTAINSITVNNFVFSATGTTANQQIYVSNGTTGYWASRFFAGDYAVIPDSPNYGDIWFSTIDNKPFMWVNNGYFDTWYDFLPPTF